MHTSIFKKQRGGKQNGYWIANQVFIVFGACVFVWLSSWYVCKGFVYTARKEGAMTPQESLLVVFS